MLVLIFGLMKEFPLADSEERRKSKSIGHVRVLLTYK